VLVPKEQVEESDLEAGNGEDLPSHEESDGQFKHEAIEEHDPKEEKTESESDQGGEGDQAREEVETKVGQIEKANTRIQKKRKLKPVPRKTSVPRSSSRKKVQLPNAKKTKKK